MVSRNILLSATVALSSGALGGCGSDSMAATPMAQTSMYGNAMSGSTMDASSSSSSSSSSAVMAQSLDTAQVLAQARETSETSTPYPVNDGALTLNDTSDTSEPISVNTSQ
jgi:hypothetical protein